MKPLWRRSEATDFSRPVLTCNTYQGCFESSFAVNTAAPRDELTVLTLGRGQSKLPPLDSQRALLCELQTLPWSLTNHAKLRKVLLIPSAILRSNRRPNSSFEA